VAVGTELLLGQIPDTNSQWLGEHLAAHGIARSSPARGRQSRTDSSGVSHGTRAQRRGDRVRRARPTQDDITRAALAEVMNVPLERDEEIVEKIARCSVRAGARCPRTTSCRPTCRAGDDHPPNARHGAGTDLCRGPKGRLRRARLPYEMTDMFDEQSCPTWWPARSLRDDVGDHESSPSHLGASESALAEAVASRFEELVNDDRVTIAFLASGIEASSSTHRAGTTTRTRRPCS